MTRFFLLIITCCLSTLAFAQIPTTQVPFTYVIDYTRLQAHKPEFRQKLSEGTPTLYHPGADLRYLGRFGFGSMVETYRNMPYATYAHQVKDYIRFLRQLGVRWIAPYFCNQTISGNAELRYGAWEVYDRWQDFSFLELGDRPADPINWMQREASGNLHYNYKRKCFLERHNDDLQNRYAPCPNHPDWRNLCNAEARTAARLGFNGLFIDNNIIHCYCPACERRFQEYLQKKYPPDALRNAFNTSDYAKITLFKEGDLRFWARTLPEFIPFLEKKYPPAQRRIFFDTMGPLEDIHVDAAGGGMLVGETAAFIIGFVLPEYVTPTFENIRLANPALQTPVGRLRWAETMMFWGHSIGAQLAEMRDAGRQINPEFFLIPNWGVFQRIDGAIGRAEDGKDLRRFRTGADWQMFEEGSATGLIAPGVVLDYDLELRYAFACGVRAMLLPYTIPDPAIEALHHAEIAASGGSVYVTTLPNPEIRSQYRDFYEKHGELFSGYRSAARVALAFLFDQCHYLNIDHLRQVHALNRYLADQQIPFDHITETDFTAERLAPYRVIILPNIVFMSDDQLATLQDFIDHGGTIICIGATATHNLYCQPRGQQSILTPEPGYSASIKQFASLDLALPYDGIYLADGLNAVQTLSATNLFNKDTDAKYRLLAELDRTLRFKRYQQPGPVTAIIATALGYYPHLMKPEYTTGIRHTVWLKTDAGANRLVIHLVNKNVPLVPVAGKRELRSVANLLLHLPGPTPEKIQAIRLWQPEQKPQEVKVTGIVNGLATCVVPELDAYLVVEVVFEQ